MLVAAAVKASAAAGAPVELLGFLNDSAAPGSTLEGIPVLGPFERWHECPAAAAFISAIPAPKEAWQRLRRITGLGIPADRWASVIHPAACVDAGAALGPGSFVGPFAVVEPGVRGGAHLCLRGGCYVSHDATLGDYVFVGPNATVLSRATIGEGAHIGPNAACIARVSVGRYAVVGIGAAVVRDVPEFAVVAGNPARQVSVVSNQ
jgi:acetyltransferase EpsM